MDLDIGEKIGEGGFGIIYAAWDHPSLKNTPPTYAIKFLGIQSKTTGNQRQLIKAYRAGFEQLVQGRKLFSREIGLLVRTAQEYIVPIVPLVCEGIVCYRMPFYASTLEAKIAAFRTPPTVATLEVLMRFAVTLWKVAHALAQLHKEDEVVHRDIKPQNILLENEWNPTNHEQNWEPVIGDFGIAGELTEGVVRTILQAGTPPYAAPEQLTGHKSAKSDVYALGKVVEKILTLSFSPDANSFRDQLQESIPPATENDLEKRWASGTLAEKWGNIIRPVLNERLTAWRNNKQYDLLLEWIDFAWSLEPEAARMTELKRIWREKLGQADLELQFFHNIKAPNTAARQVSWALGESESLSREIIPIRYRQQRGRHRYWITEATRSVPDTLDTDVALLRYAKDLSRILSQLTALKISPPSIKKSHFCLDGQGLLKLALWNPGLEQSAAVPSKRLTAQHLAELLLHFWVGKEIHPDWQADEGFFVQKVNGGWKSDRREYLMALTKVLQQGYREKFSTPESVVCQLAMTYRTFFFKDLPRVQHDKTLTESQLQNRLREINEPLADTGVAPIQWEEITRGRPSLINQPRRRTRQAIWILALLLLLGLCDWHLLSMVQEHRRETQTELKKIRQEWEAKWQTSQQQLATEVANLQEQISAAQQTPLQGATVQPPPPGGAKGNKRFQVDAKGVISDTETGLKWRVGPDDRTTWDDACKWVESLGSGWRMPTVKELEGLYEKGKGTYNLAPEFKVTNPWVWSGSLVDKDGKPSNNKDSPAACGFQFYTGQKNWSTRDRTHGCSRGFAVYDGK